MPAHPWSSLATHAQEQRPQEREGEQEAEEEQEENELHAQAIFVSLFSIHNFSAAKHGRRAANIRVAKHPLRRQHHSLNPLEGVVVHFALRRPADRGVAGDHGPHFVAVADEAAVAVCTCRRYSTRGPLSQRNQDRLLYLVAGTGDTHARLGLGFFTVLCCFGKERARVQDETWTRGLEQYFQCFEPDARPECEV